MFPIQTPCNVSIVVPNVRIVHSNMGALTVTEDTVKWRQTVIGIPNQDFHTHLRNHLQISKSVLTVKSILKTTDVVPNVLLWILLTEILTNVECGKIVLLKTVKDATQMMLVKLSVLNANLGLPCKKVSARHATYKITMMACIHLFTIDATSAVTRT